MTANFVDYHCHLLPALDDGSVDLRESLAMARILADFGFTAVHCTPHRIKGCYENDPDRVVRATESLQAVLDQAGIPLRLIPGTEHYLDEFLIDQLDGALTAAAARYLLVEAPFKSGPEMVTAMAAGLHKRRLAPLIAHPERCSAFDPQLVDEGGRGPFSFLAKKKKVPDMSAALILKLRDSGCRFQGNLGSFAGYYGSEIKERALLFLKHGVYSCVGSDAHRSERLASTLTAGYHALVAAVGEEASHRLLVGSELTP